VPGVRPISVYDVLVCHALLVPPVCPDVSVKRYRTGPQGSEPVVATMAIEVVPVALGAVAKVAGLGVGGAVSAAAFVVAEAGAEAVPVLPRLSRIVTV